MHEMLRRYALEASLRYVTSLNLLSPYFTRQLAQRSTMRDAAQLCDDAGKLSSKDVVVMISKKWPMGFFTSIQAHVLRSTKLNDHIEVGTGYDNLALSVKGDVALVE